MTPGERRALTALVKQRFKVLRSEVKARQQELTATVDHEIVARHESRDFKRQEIERLARRLAQDAATQISTAIDEAGIDQTGKPSIHGGDFRIYWGDDGRQVLRAAAVSDLKAKVEAATLRLDREEVDLLQSLAIGLLESDEARSFLASIPTVGQLVPAVVMEELEARLTEGGA